MGNPLKLLITGATGAVGPTVVREALSSPYQIRTLSLDQPHGLWEQGVEAHQGDITDPETVLHAMQGIDLVVHLAALLHIADPPASMEEKFYRINVEGTRNVMQAAVLSGVKRVVYPSTIAVYGDSSGRIITEKTIPHPDTWYAKTKLDAERIVLDAKGDDGKQLGVVLRLGAVYGARIKGNYQKLLHALARGRFIPLGKGKNRRTMIYDRDVARAVLLGLAHPGAAGKIYNVSDGSFHTLNQIVEVMCSALTRPVPRLSIPLLPVRVVTGLVEWGSKLTGIHPPISRSMVDKYTEDMAVDSSLIRSELGFIPAYDLLRGWSETIDIMRRAGNL